MPVKASSPRRNLTYGDLLTFAHSNPTSFDVAEVNLLCARGLPGVGDLRIPECLDIIDKWSDRVRDETQRRHAEYRQSPEKFANSEARFRLSVLADVLRNDAGLYYDYPPLLRQPTADTNQPQKNLFQDPRNLFIHGVLLKQTPPTSITLTVIVAALGRRQGYPLKLATAKTHGIVRWDDGKERINIEVTSRGLMVFPDETYREVCLKGLKPAEQNSYLESLSPSQELAVFLSRRAACLAASGKLIDAEVCWAHSWELNPTQRITASTLRTMVTQECLDKTGSAPALGPLGPGTQYPVIRENDLPLQIKNGLLRDPRKGF